MALEISGLNKLIQQLENVINNEWIEQGISTSCERMVASAKENLTENGNVETGELRNSITYNVEKTKNSISAEVGTNVEYAAFVEFGTGIHNSRGEGRNTPWCYKDPITGEFVWTNGSKPHPYMEPAYQENKGKIKKDLKDALERVVR